MTRALTIQERYQGGILIVELSGRLDALSVTLASSRLMTFVERGDRHLLVHLGQVDYLNSTGIRLILRLFRELKKNEGQLVLCAPTREVLDVLRLSGTDQFISIAKDEKEALDKFLLSCK